MTIKLLIYYQKITPYTLLKNNVYKYEAVRLINHS